MSAPQDLAQLVTKLPGRYLPAAQLVHVSLCASAKPALHVHNADPDGELEFMRQDLHVSPGFFVYLSASHGVHKPPSGPENPGLHLQICLSLDDSEFAGHTVQGTFPIWGLNVLAGQALQDHPDIAV